MKLEMFINGEAYPYRENMGAMLRFKHETGKDASQMDFSKTEDLAVWIWCCVKSGCQLAGKPFNMPLVDFADHLEDEQIRAWADAKKAEVEANITQIQSDLAKIGEKKSPQQ